MCLYFFNLTHFRGQGRNPGNNFVAFLENLRHPKFVLRLTDLQTVPFAFLIGSIQEFLEQSDSISSFNQNSESCPPFLWAKADSIGISFGTADGLNLSKYNKPSIFEVYDTN